MEEERFPTSSYNVLRYSSLFRNYFTAESFFKKHTSSALGKWKYLAVGTARHWTQRQLLDDFIYRTGTDSDTHRPLCSIIYRKSDLEQVVSVNMVDYDTVDPNFLHSYEFFISTVVKTNKFMRSLFSCVCTFATS